MAVVSGSLAYATTIASSKVTACADKKTGILRVTAKCKSTEKSVPLISGSVQLAPAYTDTRGTAVNVLTADFGATGSPNYLDAIVSGKVVDIYAPTGQVSPIGSFGTPTNNYFLNLYRGPHTNPLTYPNATCSGTPFLWLPIGSEYQDTERIASLYRDIKTNANYAGYFTFQYGETQQHLSISSSPVGFAPGMEISHRDVTNGDCEQDTTSNGGSGYTSNGYQTIALNIYTGARLANFAGPIGVKAQ